LNLKRNEFIHGGAILLLCLLLFMAGLGARDIWDIDEGMHAAIAQTMVNSGDWVTPRFNSEPFFDKPVLFNWLNAAAFVLLGASGFAARLTAAAAGLGAVFLTYLFGRRIYAAKTGLLAAVILATSLEVIALSRVVQYDMLFTFFTTLALYCFGFAVIEDRRQKIYFAGFYAAVALAVLTKGPLGLLIPALVIGGYLTMERRLSFLKEMQIPMGVLICSAIAAPWYLMMEQANPGYLDYFIFKQHFGNFLGGEGVLAPRHPEPFFYYLPVLLGGMLPWSLMLPQALAKAMRKDRDAGRGLSRYLVVWVFAVFVFFSLATSKLSTYILPLIPAAALLLGRYWHGILDSPGARPGRGTLPGVAAMFVLLAIVTLYATIENPWTYWNYRSGVRWADFELFMVLLSALFGLASLFLWTRRNVAGFVTLSAISPFVIFYILLVIAPGADPYKGAREIGMELADALPPGEAFRFHGQLLDSAMFYTDRNAVMLNTEEELNQYLSSGERVFVLLRTRARTREESFAGDYHVIKITGNKAIVSNRPGPL